MDDVQQLVQQLPTAMIAKQASVSEREAAAALQQIVPALVGGMSLNAQAPTGAASLERALAQHAGNFDSRVAGNIDAADGDKIVQHIFQGRADEVAAALDSRAAAVGGSGPLGDIIKKILPIVAPMVISWIANRVLGGGRGSGSAAPSPAPASKGDNPFANSWNSNTAPGGSLPNTSGSAPGRNAQTRGGELGGLGDILGGMLGGSGGGLGDLLGGILGGHR